MAASTVVVACLLLLFPSRAPAADPWADEVVDASPELDGSGLYNDPQSVLGMPATTFYDDWFSLQYEVSLVAGAYNLDAPLGNKLITSIEVSQFIKVGFDEPVRDDPGNPYGIDFIVFGNSFFVGSDFVYPDTNMEALSLTSTLLADLVTVAVSPTGIGDPQTHPEHWYVYDAGPFADALFPTNAYAWDRDSADWGEPLDFTTPVDPSLQIEDFAQLSAADAMDLYRCSAGGTGYDLAEAGFPLIRYVYLTGEGGEVDALADVFPSLGDFDRDGDVDLFDIAGFQNCFEVRQEGGAFCTCRSADFDGVGDIDLSDYAQVSSLLTGPR